MNTTTPTLALGLNSFCDFVAICIDRVPAEPARVTFACRVAWGAWGIRQFDIVRIGFGARTIGLVTSLVAMKEAHDDAVLCWSVY
jgi:hypothetical protein